MSKCDNCKGTEIDPVTSKRCPRCRVPRRSLPIAPGEVVLRRTRVSKADDILMENEWADLGDRIVKGPIFVDVGITIFKRLDGPTKGVSQ